MKYLAVLTRIKHTGTIPLTETFNTGSLYVSKNRLYFDVHDSPSADAIEMTRNGKHAATAMRQTAMVMYAARDWMYTPALLLESLPTYESIQDFY